MRLRAASVKRMTHLTPVLIKQEASSSFEIILTIAQKGQTLQLLGYEKLSISTQKSGTHA